MCDEPLGKNEGDKVIVVVTLLANVWAWQPYDLAVRRLKIDGRIDTAPPIQTISVNREIVIRTRMMGAVNHEVGPPALDFCTMTG